MQHNAPFLALPDHRENLIYEFIPGQSVSPIANLVSGGPDLIIKAGASYGTGELYDDGLLYPVLKCNDEVTTAGIHYDVAVGANYLGTGVLTTIMLLKFAEYTATGAKFLDTYPIDLSIKTVVAQPSITVYTIDETELYEDQADIALPNDPTSDYFFLAFTFDVPNKEVKIYVNGVYVDTMAVRGDSYGYSSIDDVYGDINYQATTADVKIAYMRSQKVLLTTTQMQDIQNLIRRKVMGRAPKL